MSHDLLLGEVVFSPIVAACLLAFALAALTSWALIRLNLYRWLWRRPLVEVALFCIWLGLISAFSPLPGTR